jgi:hypothetical protein
MSVSRELRVDKLECSWVVLETVKRRVSSTVETEAFSPVTFGEKEGILPEEWDGHLRVLSMQCILVYKSPQQRR